MGGLTTGQRPSWPLILADLALILFLITLTGLGDDTRRERDPGLMAAARGGAREIAARREPKPVVEPAQALYRPVPGGPGLSEWLASQPADPRATLTIFARYRRGERAAAWQRADALAQEAAEGPLAVRIILTRSEESDTYASLAYDVPTEPPLPAGP